MQSFVPPLPPHLRLPRARPLCCATAKPSFSVPAFYTRLLAAQSALCARLEALDGGAAAFTRDAWSLGPSHGLTRVLQAGAVVEKGGVNTSFVAGALNAARAEAMRGRGRSGACREGADYSAAALSFVLHFRSPWLPTLRGDVRVFRVGDEVWGGGGVDLTPCYFRGAEGLFRAWHRFWRDVCVAYGRDYAEMKRGCDEYFYLPMRGQHRGVGGLFFDDLKLGPEEMEAWLEGGMLGNFIKSYEPILEAMRGVEYSEGQKRFQKMRRSVYVEFNLTRDRGVKFGLGRDKSRTDAIMISAPPEVEWVYGYKADEGSAEEEAIAILSGPPLDWAGESKV